MEREHQQLDRRVRRTKRMLTNALIELIQEKHYDSITVQDIIDRADVGRSTFYKHFRDKEDLFRGDWERFLVLLIEQFGLEKIEESGVLPVSHLFEHLKEFHPFYRGLRRSGKVESIFAYGQKHLAKLIEEKLVVLPQTTRRPFVPTEILANYISTEIFAFLRWWLDHNMPYSPHQMDEFFHTLVIPGIRASLTLETTAS